jgi:hypothetical protein
VAALVPSSASSRSSRVSPRCPSPLLPLTAPRFAALTLPGVKSYNVSLETQTAEIVTEESLDYETVLEKIKKTGKTVKSGEADGSPRDV